MILRLFCVKTIQEHTFGHAITFSVSAFDAVDDMRSVILDFFQSVEIKIPQDCL
jgi:hypothetical protein